MAACLRVICSDDTYGQAREFHRLQHFLRNMSWMRTATQHLAVLDFQPDWPRIWHKRICSTWQLALAAFHETNNLAHEFCAGK